MKKVFITTNACTVVRHDTYVYSKYFELNGWDEVAECSEADLVLVSCCAVTQRREDQAIKLIEDLKTEMKESAQLVVAGCLPRINPERLCGVFDGVSFTSKESEVLDNLISAKVKIKDAYYDGDVKRIYHSDHELKDTNLINRRMLALSLKEKYNDDIFMDIYKQLTKGQHHYGKQDNSYLVKIAEGCNYNCSFCATKFVKGKLISRDQQKVLQEFKVGVEKGYKKIMLMGDELGDYGRDISSSLSELLDLLVQESGDAKIGIRYLEPNALVREFDKMRKYIESGKIYFICTSIQTGSPKILKLMNRNPDITSIVHTIKKIKELNSDIYLFTQLIVGFPQETEQDFNMTLDMIKECKFDFVTTSLYSNRPNTKSSALEGQIKKEVIDQRYKNITRISDLLAEESFLNRISKEVRRHEDLNE